MGVLIWAKLSDLLCEYSGNVPANFIEIAYMVKQIQQFKL